MSGIAHYESKRLYEKSASSPDFMDDFMCLANRFNAVFTNGIKVSNRTAASEIYQEFIYLC